MQDRAKSLERIARELEGTLFNITHEGSARVIAEQERRVAEIEALRTEDGSNAEQIDRLIAQSAAVREAPLSQLRAKEGEAAEQQQDDPRPRLRCRQPRSLPLKSASIRRRSPAPRRSARNAGGRRAACAPRAA